MLASGGEVGAVMRTVDWALTAIGPVDRWPQSLRSAVSICLASRFPIVMYWGPEYTVLYNDAYSHILGAKHPWALGKTCAETWAEIWDTIGPMLDNVVATGTATWSDDLELHLVRHGAPEECYFSFSFSPVRVEDGSVGGVFTAVVETTQRVLSDRRFKLLAALGEKAAGSRSPQEAGRRCVDALAGSRAVPFSMLYLCEDSREAVLVAASGLGSDSPLLVPRITVDDPGARIRLPLNPPPGDPVRVPIQPLELGDGCVWAHDVPPANALILPIGAPEHGRSTGYLIAGLNPLRPFDDSYRTFAELLGKQIAGALGDAEAYESERRRAEALADLDRTKTQFFSDVSHEFRTPLTLLLGPLESMLQDTGDDAARARSLQMAHRNAQRLLKLVDTLLDFSKIGATGGEVNPQPIDLAAYTAELASVFRSAVEHAGLALEVDCSDLGALVEVDPEMWEKVVLNLLSNALKFTVAGSISVRVARSDGDAILTVADTGIGIEPDSLPRIFDRFYRVRDTRSRTHEGAGIGLALVKEMVELMHGTISVTSALGEGTRFEVRVPMSGGGHAERAAAPRATGTLASGYVAEAMGWLDVGGGTGSALAAGSSDPAVNAAARRVLVVDDNPDMRAYIARLLGEHWPVEAAADGVEALAAILDRRPDLVLTDVMMPRMDGFQLLDAIRSDPLTRDIPVVMLSARAGEESAGEGLASGADDYLVKPFTAEQLVARVRANLELAAMRVQLASARAEARIAGERAAFVNMAAHELRTPLAIIGGFTDLILGGYIDQAGPQARDALRRVAAKTRETTHLVDQMLVIARLDAGAIEVTVADADLRDVVRDAVDASSDLCELRGIQLAVALPDQPVPAVVDRNLTRVVIDNLIVNAITHGSSPISVQVEADPPRVTVIDSGNGVPADMRERVFDPYFQVNGQTRGKGGAGLGLAVGRRLAGMQGGTLVLNDTPGGASFTLALARARSSEGR